MLCRFLYYSEMARTVDAGTIDTIVATALENNRRRDITGALVAQSGYFLQVLEGRRMTLNTMFQTLCGDERHGNVTLMSFTEAHLRWYANWNMVDITNSHLIADGLRLATGEIVGFEPPKLHAHRALDLFMNASRFDRVSA